MAAIRRRPHRRSPREWLRRSEAEAAHRLVPGVVAGAGSTPACAASAFHRARRKQIGQPRRGCPSASGPGGIFVPPC